MRVRIYDIKEYSSSSISFRLLDKIVYVNKHEIIIHGVCNDAIVPFLQANDVHNFTKNLVGHKQVDVKIPVWLEAITQI